MDRIPAVPIDKGVEPTGQVLRMVEFRDVWFKYKGRDKVGDGVSLFVFLKTFVGDGVPLFVFGVPLFVVLKGDGVSLSVFLKTFVGDGVPRCR